MNAHKCSQACSDCTGSPELGCQCQTSENFGKISMITPLNGNGGYCFVDFSDS